MAWHGVVDVCDGHLAAEASDRDNVTRQTLRAGIHAPPPEKPYVTHRAELNVPIMALRTI